MAATDRLRRFFAEDQGPTVLQDVRSTKKYFQNLETRPAGGVCWRLRGSLKANVGDVRFKTRYQTCYFLLFLRCYCPPPILLSRELTGTSTPNNGFQTRFHINAELKSACVVGLPATN